MAERVRGFEPLTVCLGSRYATTASHPHFGHYSQETRESQVAPDAGRIPRFLPVSAGIPQSRGSTPRLIDALTQGLLLVQSPDQSPGSRTCSAHGEQT